MFPFRCTTNAASSGSSNSADLTVSRIRFQRSASPSLSISKSEFQSGLPDTANLNEAFLISVVLDSSPSTNLAGSNTKTMSETIGADPLIGMEISVESPANAPEAGRQKHAYLTRIR